MIRLKIWIRSRFSSHPERIFNQPVRLSQCCADTRLKISLIILAININKCVGMLGYHPSVFGTPYIHVLHILCEIYLRSLAWMVRMTSSNDSKLNKTWVNLWPLHSERWAQLLIWLLVQSSYDSITRKNIMLVIIFSKNCMRAQMFCTCKWNNDFLFNWNSNIIENNIFNST